MLMRTETVYQKKDEAEHQSATGANWNQLETVGNT